MADTEVDLEYRAVILSRLRQRNEDERSFAEIVTLSNNLFDAVDLLQKENLNLRMQNAKLEQNIIQFHGEPRSTQSTDQGYFEKKVYQLQEELTELHRKKGEFAQQVIDLRNTLDEKNKELAAKCSELLGTETALNLSKETCKMYQQRVTDAELNLQLLKDEYDALHLTYKCLEDKKQKLEKDHQELISQWIAIKERDADLLNAETENIQKLKQAKLQKDLEEAASEPVILDAQKMKRSMCIEAAIPRKMMYKFDAHDAEVNAAVWTSTGNKLVTGGGDRKVKTWDIPLASQPVLRGVAHESNSSVMSLDLDWEENFVLAASWDFASRVWTINDLKIRHTLTGHSAKVMASKFLADSKVVSGSHDRTLKIWDLRRRACVRTIFTGSSCNDVVTCGGNTLVSGHFDKRIKFWDMRTGTDSNRNELLLQGKITSLDVSHDGFSLLICVRDDNTLKLVDIRMNRVIRTFSADGFMVGCDWTRAKFSPDAQFCIAGSQDGSITIWTISTGKVEKTLKEHNTTVTTCSWSPTGQNIISCDKNRKCVLWSDF